MKEDCDELSYTNWSSEIDCGEFPLLIYEVLNEYRTFDFENIPRDELSYFFKQHLEKIINEQNWTEDDLERLVASGKIFYADGSEQQANVLIDECENVSDTIFEVSCTTKIEINTVYFCDIEGIENVLNLENIAMLELPLLPFENKIYDEYIRAVEKQFKIWTSFLLIVALLLLRMVSKSYHPLFL
ncbi:hypothetical protein [Faecalicoccus pleomorphus]|uniref:hypothetical protein n=1 Tax=Faecalicoccus pleomorphus TaxID=1323 RepID=UPI0025A438C4|nr:hypothetical protein [Faecalicoccus pleomorphus]MDM8293489.1 hypothetical protein [Faecalicoccus pleomorphus]